MKTVGNKRDIMAVVIRNAAGSTIPTGTPIALNMNGTNDGLDVILPSSSAAKADAFMYGVTLGPILDQQYGEAQVFGFCNNIVLLRQTRSASTADWSSNSDGFGTGVLLNIDTVGDRFSTSGGTLAKSAFAPFAVLAEAVASWASTVTSNATADTRLSITVASKAFLRMM
jgi:hypothetical protein